MKAAATCMAAVTLALAGCVATKPPPPPLAEPTVSSNPCAGPDSFVRAYYSWDDGKTFAAQCAHPERPLTPLLPTSIEPTPQEGDDPPKP